MHERTLGITALTLAALLCLSVVGCGGGGADRLKAFLREPRGPVAGVPYRVLPPDTLTFRSFYVPEINNITQQVRPDGKVNLPLVGEIDVAGKTAKEIEEAITKAAKDFYEQVDANVQVTGFNSQRIFVFGQVSRPGPQAWTGRNTLLDVIAESLPTELAWPERIIVVRGGPPLRGGYLEGEELEELAKEAEPAKAAAQEDEEPFVEGEGKPAAEGDKKPAAGVIAKVRPQEGETIHKTKTDVTAADGPKAHTMRFNMMAMIKKGNMSQNVYLEPDDVIYVPANPLAAVGLAIQQILLPIRPAAETVSTPASAARMATTGGI
jgi:protein involved in polysaccharide export with SLBB domain